MEIKDFLYEFSSKRWFRTKFHNLLMPEGPFTSFASYDPRG